MKHSNLYLGLVLPSGGWQSLISSYLSCKVLQNFLVCKGFISFMQKHYAKKSHRDKHSSVFVWSVIDEN